MSRNQPTSQQPTAQKTSAQKPAGKVPTISPPAHLVQARENAELLVPFDEVIHAIDQVSVRITLALADLNPLVICVLQGGVAFAGALQVRLHFPMQSDVLRVSRYGSGTQGGQLQWELKPKASLRDRVVLFVDDVLDRGETLTQLCQWAREEGAAEIHSAVLVEKAVAQPRQISADFVALNCPDRFLLGWGMDVDEYWRNLDGIYALDPADPLVS